MINFFFAGIDSCNGDSGGPLFVSGTKDGTFYLEGVVSYGSKECGTGYPGVYTNIEYYMQWILKNMRP